MTEASGDVWIEAALAAFGDTAENALMLPRPELRGLADAMPDGLSGSFIALSGEGEAAQVGLAGSAEACALAAGALMQLPADEAARLSTSEVADAMGEIVNIAAGALKERLRPALGKLVLGLPLFIHGQVARTEKVETRVAEVRLGALELAVVVVRARKGTGT